MTPTNSLSKELRTKVALIKKHLGDESKEWVYEGIEKLIEAERIKAKIDLLDRLEQSIDQHTTPEGENLLTRSYVKNTLEYERQQLKGE